MHGCRRFMLLAGLGLAVIAGGCQGSGGSTSSGGGGPSLTFGQVPPQSEPPVEEASSGRKTAARSAPSDAGDTIDGEDSTAAAKRKARWLAGNEKDPAPRKTIPVSARTDSFADDDQDR